MRARYSTTLRLEHMWSPIQHLDQESVQEHYRRMLVRFEKLYDWHLRRRNLNSDGVKLMGYALMAIRREAE